MNKKQMGRPIDGEGTLLIFLSAFLLTVSRACVAMRWPPPFPSTPHSEKLPPPGYPVQVNIRHGDMHANNVLVGGLVPGNKEHEISPIIKVPPPAPLPDCSRPGSAPGANGDTYRNS